MIDPITGEKHENRQIPQKAAFLQDQTDKTSKNIYEGIEIEHKEAIPHRSRLVKPKLLKKSTTKAALRLHPIRIPSSSAYEVEFPTKSAAPQRLLQI